jgi:hypothetical protein
MPPRELARCVPKWLIGLAADARNPLNLQAIFLIRVLTHYGLSGFFRNSLANQCKLKRRFGCSRAGRSTPPRGPEPRAALRGPRHGAPHRWRN